MSKIKVYICLTVCNLLFLSTQAQKCSKYFTGLNTYYDDKFNQPVTVYGARLYSDADTGSSFIELSAKTYFQPVKTGSCQNIKWYRAEINDTVSGYLKSTDIIPFIFSDNNGTDYLSWNDTSDWETMILVKQHYRLTIHSV